LIYLGIEYRIYVKEGMIKGNRELSFIFMVVGGAIGTTIAFLLFIALRNYTGI
jgi:hypothetical protein